MRRKISLRMFRKIKNGLLSVLNNSHRPTSSDFDQRKDYFLRQMKKKRASKMQVVRFKQLIKKAARDYAFNPYTGD